MGVDVRLQLIDMDCYARKLLPAHRAWIERRDGNPAVVLLREAAALAPDVDSELDLNDFKRHPRYVKRSKELADAVARQERAAVDEMLSLVSELSTAQWEPGLITKTTAADALRILGASGRDAEVDRAMHWVLPALLDLMCLPWKAPQSPVQNVSSKVFAEWLAEGPARLLRIFEGMPSGEELALSTGESTTLLSEGDVALLADELSRPRDHQPTDRLQRELEHLKSMVEMARRNPSLRLGLTSL
ncbi:MAG: hypothetical protein NDI82_07845 [Anaeromyxobacteraceae bacterium]|nr:hypothetical protein [Anaeromyxobacteraceae bacterium]